MSVRFHAARCTTASRPGEHKRPQRMAGPSVPLHRATHSPRSSPVHPSDLDQLDPVLDHQRREPLAFRLARVPVSKQQPNKPSAPLGAIVWPAGGGQPRLIREDLPPTKEALEAAIMRKFTGALQERDGRRLELDDRTDPNGWPDFEGVLAGRRIGIEVVEAIAPDHARKRARQHEYLRELLPRVADLEVSLRGISLTLDDGYQVPEWPPVHSRKGQRLLKQLEANLRAAAPELQRVGPRGCLLSWTGAPNPCTGVMAMRARPLPGSPATPVDLHFAGTSLITASFLANTVLGKVDKGYPTLADGDLWLLVYAEHGMVVERDAVALARIVLAGTKHPFRAVWAFFPFPGQDRGMLEELYPATDLLDEAMVQLGLDTDASRRRTT